MSLKAVIIDSHALSRDLLGTVLRSGSYEIVASLHTSGPGLAAIQKHRPHFACIEREIIEESNDIVAQIRSTAPKTLVFMVASEIDQATLQSALARGVSGFIIKPFNADAVLKTLRNAVLAMIKKQQG